MKRSIASKILVVVIVLIVLLAFGLLGVTSYFMNALTDTLLLNIMQPMAKTAAQSVEANLHVLADRFFLIRNDEAFVSADTTNEDKQQLLDRAKMGIEFDWLGLYDTEGILLTGSEDCPLSLVGRDVLSGMKETVNLVIEDTTVGVNGLQIVMGAPIMAANQVRGKANTGTVAYYLVGSYAYNILNDVLSNINIGANGSAFIVSSEGRLVAHKSKGKVYGRESIDRNLGFGEDAERVVKLMKEGQTGASSITSANDQMLFVSFAPVRGTNWSLGIQAPRSDYMDAVDQVITINVQIILSGLVLLTAILMFLIRAMLTKPLHVITKKAHSLADGQFETELPKRISRRKDEIGQLAGAFNTMTVSILLVIRDVGFLIEAARTGSMNTRVEVSSQQGDYNVVLKGMNATLDAVCAHLDAMPNAFALFGAEEEVLYQNAAMQEILFRHEAQIAGDRPLDTFVGNPEGRGLVPGAAWLFNPGCVDGMDYKGEIALTDSMGEERNYVLSMTRTGGDTICVMLIISDVTMLTRAREAAEAASKAKGDFLSNMSHEMRTPMNAIIGMTAIAKTSDAVERKDYCLGKIEDASTHLLGVINDILDMSKIEAKKFELSAVPFAFERVMQKAANVINFRIDEKHQNFTVRIDTSIPRMLMGDDQRLMQVLTNLLSNAVKFTPENGDIRMEARMIGEEDGLCTIQMEVTDTGIGISEEQKNRLFASFQQADSGTSRRFGGTGLGLAISKNIAEMMGGAIWVESELGKGSTFAFTVRLPRAAEEHQCLVAPGVSWKNLNVLMVDDAVEIREYFDEMAKQIGFVCDTAESGEEALQKIAENGPYDMYFVDWKMPGMDGIELSRRIKEGSIGNSVVIMISATEWTVIEDSAREVGVDKFVPKPLFPSSITDCINECLGSGGQRPDEEADKAEEEIFEGYRILLAEDVEINREIVLALLEPTRIEIDCAENGAEALRMFEAAPDKYDMIFMDVQMPEMDGYEATRRIRQSQHPQGEEIPIVAMTANVFREDIDRCLESGMNDHVGKPLDMDDVRRKIRQYLPKKG